VNASNGEQDPSSRGPDASDSPIDKTATDRLLGRWVHSHEEDEPGRMVFRKGDRTFPPSRGRVSLAMEPGGVVVVGGPGPDDRQSTGAGRWVVDGTHLSVNAPGWSGDFDVEQVEGDKLVLRRR
jgi:hypothetical protein